MPATADLTGIARPDQLRELFDQLQRSGPGTWAGVATAYRSSRPGAPPRLLGRRWA